VLDIRRAYAVHTWCLGESARSDEDRIPKLLDEEDRDDEHDERADPDRLLSGAGDLVRNKTKNLTGGQHYTARRG
jgi:hypothetical protein